MQQQRIKGFTAIELMVLLTVVAILLLVALPSFVSLVQRYRISGQAETLYSTLQYARQEAIKRSTAVYVSFSTGDNWCYGLNTGSACDCTVSSSCNLGVQAAPSTGQTSLSTSGMSNMNFEQTHGAANSAGSVTLTLYGQSSLITINISRMGGLSLCSTGISGYTAC